MNVEDKIHELRRRVDEMKHEKASREALELITKGLSKRIERVESTQVWAFRTVILSALAVIGQGFVVMVMIFTGT